MPKGFWFRSEGNSQGATRYPSLSTPLQRGTSPLECWYSGVMNQTAYGAASFAVGNITCYPVVIGRSGFIDRIAFETTVISGAGGVARCGIYSNTSRTVMYPNELIVDGGSIATDGAIGVKSTTINAFLKAGLYWFAWNSGVSACTTRLVPVGGSSPIFGIPSTMGATPYDRLGGAVAYAAFPSTAPVGLILATSQAPTLVHVRFSS